MDSKILRKRLVEFSVNVMALTKSMNYSVSSKHLPGQISRSSTSVALNYSEALEAESRRDMLHKLKICLKELRETETSLMILDASSSVSNEGLLKECQQETDELISIFVTTISTLKRNGI